MTKQKKFQATRRRVGSIELEVCRRDDQYGKGPCFSVYKHGLEVMRFDLFPIGAHFHLYRESGQPRHYFARDGSSFQPAAPDMESGARRAPSPPWDVLVRVAHAEALSRFPQLGNDGVYEWLVAELARRQAEPTER